MLNCFFSACILQAGRAGSLYVNTTISMRWSKERGQEGLIVSVHAVTESVSYYKKAKLKLYSKIKSGGLLLKLSNWVHV